MIDQIVNIFFELKKAFTPAPKKEECTNMQRWYHPPEHINCRCISRPIAFDEEITITSGDGRTFSIPPSFESRRARFDEACHDDFPFHLQAQGWEMTFTDRMALQKHIDAIYDKPKTLLETLREIESPKASCVVCFNLECSCY